MSGLDMELASGIAAFEAKEFARAMQLLQPLAERGDPQAQYRVDRKSTRLNSSHTEQSRMPSSA